MTGSIFFTHQSLSFKKPSKQAAERFRAINANVLTTNFRNIEHYFWRLNIEATHPFKLDETGMTPGNDCYGGTHRKSVIQRGTRCNAKGLDFVSKLSRMSLLACVTAFVDFQGESPCLSCANFI